MLVLACAAGAGTAESARTEVARAIARGREFLVTHQNRDGSWGNAHTKDLNVWAPVPGAHYAFRTAVTALCVSALLETGTHDDRAREAARRGEQWLLANLARTKRVSAGVMYNIWSHAYAIRALLRAREATGDTARRERLLAAAAEQVTLLETYQALDGGWGYYDWGPATRRPTASTSTVVTATTLVALREARDAGVPVPERMVRRALKALKRTQKPDRTYLYTEDWKMRPMGRINLPPASLSRSQACNLALHTWQDDSVNQAVLTAWLERLIRQQGWLDLGRKKPVPHESYFGVAGYFFYYGFYYAAQCLERLPADARVRFGRALAEALLPRQEKDGSWWDYPLYGYHKPYGTAYALMALERTEQGTNETGRTPPAGAPEQTEKGDVHDR